MIRNICSSADQQVYYHIDIPKVARHWLVVTNVDVWGGFKPGILGLGLYLETLAPARTFQGCQGGILISIHPPLS